MGPRVCGGDEGGGVGGLRQHEGSVPPSWYPREYQIRQFEGTSAQACDAWGMAGRNRRPAWHADPDAVRRVVARTVFTTLDVDWLGVDATGKVAVFLGELDASPVPSLASPKDTSLALEAVAATLATRNDARKEEAYRVASARPGEPIFDVPTAGGAPLHERLFDGYPHLFVATDAGAAEIRELEWTYGGWEVASRASLAVAVADVGEELYRALHDEGACAGCRAVEDPADPRPRSAETLAIAGLYVFVFGTDEHGLPVWIRVASPSDPANRQELQDLARHEAAFVPFDVRFEDMVTLVTPSRARRG